jgi:hypothetical protein
MKPILFLLGLLLLTLYLTREPEVVRCDGGESDQEQPDHAQNPEHPFFLEWQRAEEERRIDERIRRALNSE